MNVEVRKNNGKNKISEKGKDTIKGKIFLLVGDTVVVVGEREGVRVGAVEGPVVTVLVGVAVGD